MKKRNRDAPSTTRCSVAPCWIARRRYRWRPPAGGPKIVDVKIGLPVRSRGDWACRLSIAGLPREKDIDQLVYGIDSVQALEMSLVGAGRLMATSPEFRAGQIEALGEPALHPAALALPLPLTTLQGTLENLQAYLERERGAGSNPEWRRGLLSVMREISADLATLAAYVPVRSRRRRGSV